MAHKHQYLTFYVHLTDLAQLAPLQAADGPYLVAPDGDPVSVYHANKVMRDEAVVAPCTTSEWYGTSDQFPTNVASFDRKSGGWFGISWLFGSTTTYHWSGKFVFDPLPTVVETTGIPVVPMQVRRWIDGFELPATGEGGTGTYLAARESSRHADGFGFGIRGTTDLRSHATNENGGSMVAQSWERFYVRIRQLPTASAEFWRCQEGTVSAALGMALAVLPSGQISVSSVNAAGVRTLGGSFPSPALTLDQWYRLDLIITFGASPSLFVYLGGVLMIAMSNATMVTGTTMRHNTSTIGVANANDLAMDIDDWMNALPAQGTDPAANRLFQIISTPAGLVVSPAGTPDVLNNVDWINGSRMLLVNPSGGSTLTNWTGDWRIALQNPVGADTLALASSTTLADLVLTSDAEQSIDALPESIGLAAILIATWSKRGAASGKLGLGLLGAAPTLTAIVEATSLGWNHIFTSIANGVLTTPPKKTPILLGYQKGAGADAGNVVALQAVAEVLGVFGAEDAHVTATGLAQSTVDALPPYLGNHNAPYPRTPWARLTVPGPQPIMVRSGSYVGNGTAQDLKFPVPVHFLWIRPVTGDTGGTKWWSALMGAHKSHQQGTDADLMPQACIDPDWVGGGNDDYNASPPTLPATPATLAEALDLANQLAYGYAKHLNNGYWDSLFASDPEYAWRRMLGFEAAGADVSVYGLYASPISRWNTAQQQTLVRIVGNDSQNNAVGVTYAYFAIGDPGMRFMCNGQLTNPKGAVDEVTTLVHSSFHPDAAFFFFESLTASATAGLHYKGPGHATATVQPLNGAQVASAVELGTAAITTKSAFHALVAGHIAISYAAFRNDDGSVDGDTLVSQSGLVVQILSYVGDGVSPRNIALTPASGKRPLFAIVLPTGAAGVQRDAAHTGTTSTTIPSTATAANGIRGGDIDVIIVGSDLNANGTTYNVFCVPGGTTALNAGWSDVGDFFPVSPDPPPGAPTPGDPSEPEPGEEPPADTVPPIVVDPPPPVGPMPGLTDDLEPACTVTTHRICNLALSRLGVTQQVTDLNTETTLEAVQIRLCYADAMEATLRDFPWPFATRYATLQLATSTQPSTEWLYSYTRPSDCVFERRLVVARSGAVDPTPPPFQLSSNPSPDTSVSTPNANYGRIFTNQPSAVLEYTCRPKCPLTWSEPLFREAFAWRLAFAMAPGLSRMTSVAIEADKAYWATIQLARDVIRPGNPGAVPAAATVDLTDAAQTANVNLVNLALVRIGARSILTMDTDQSREAQAARLVFENELRATLRDFPWPFATKYDNALTFVDGDADDPDDYANADWIYSYRAPTDLVFARRLVNATARRAYDPNPLPFKMGQDTTGGLLYTDVGPDDTTGGPPVLEYTCRPEACVQIADPLFRDAFAWRLSASMAPSLAQLIPETPEQFGRGPSDPNAPKDRPSTGTQLRSKAADTAWRMYRIALAKAEIAAANETQSDPAPVDADWIRGRE